MPTERSSRSFAAAAKAVVISAAAPTRETTTKPTKAFDIPSESAAPSTAPTKASLTSATRTVAPPSTTRPTGSGQCASPSPPVFRLRKSSAWVLSEKRSSSAYVARSTHERLTLKGPMNDGTLCFSLRTSADGIRSAIVARKSIAVWSRAPAGLNSWTCLRSPPRRNDPPSMKSELLTIAPATDARTRSVMPARSAVIAITSSVRFPNVALRRPPTASPVFAATLSVARLRSPARGTIAATDRKKTSVCAPGLACSTASAIGTNTISASSGWCRRSARTAFIGCLPDRASSPEGGTPRASRPASGDRRLDEVREHREGFLPPEVAGLGRDHGGDPLLEDRDVGAHGDGAERDRDGHLAREVGVLEAVRVADPLAR